jgi:hypothetical protein
MSKPIKSSFIAGYKHDENQLDILWLCTHPQSKDLIFSKDENAAFVFTEQALAMNAMSKILIAEKHFLFIPVTKELPPDNHLNETENPITLAQMEVKITELLKLFNERSNSHLQLFLTLNDEDNSIRGYGLGLKIDEAVTHFVALLAIKGLQVKQVEKTIFVVQLEKPKKETGHGQN